VFQRSKKVALLQNIPLFRGLSRKQLAQIERLVDEITVPAESRLATAGQHGAELVVIVEGRATVTVGRRRTVRLGPGDFFGEMSLVDGGPRSATVEAASDMRLLVIGGREFSELLEKAPPIVVKIMRVLSCRVRDAEASVSA
jgi:CRP/FNR family transcriptional regulator, cyclic AMP receptor protein